MPIKSSSPPSLILYIIIYHPVCLAGKDRTIESPSPPSLIFFIHKYISSCVPCRGRENNRITITIIINFIHNYILSCVPCRIIFAAIINFIHNYISFCAPCRARRRTCEPACRTSACRWDSWAAHLVSHNPPGRASSRAA